MVKTLEEVNAMIDAKRVELLELYVVRTLLAMADGDKEEENN